MWGLKIFNPCFGPENLNYNFIVENELGIAVAR
jgi:hypothetical protein